MVNVRLQDLTPFSATEGGDQEDALEAGNDSSKCVVDSELVQV